MASKDIAGGSNGGVFISYSRADGEEFATRLRLRLEAEKIPLVWQDRDQMYGGHDWWLQIEGALKQVEFLVLVITKGSIESKVVRKEWRFGLQEGVCVFGVKGAADARLEDLPGWMGSKHIYNIGALEGEGVGPEWETFVDDLRKPCRQPRVPFMAEDLPAGYVPREGELLKLKGSLLDPAREEAVAVTAALSGAGGFGKTTLAQALCHDDDVQTFFHGGVLWTTLGERPGELTPYVNELVEALGDPRPSFVTLNAAEARLRELLANRTLLFVVDDVWNAAHLRPFMQGGPRCTRLITTRVLDAAPPKAVKVEVDAMRPEEAVSLLRFDLPDGLGAELKELASALGEWPLLLRLANGVLRYRVNDREQPLADALQFVADDLRENGLVAFDAADPEARDQAVAATVGVSVAQLREDERGRFGALAVFPEDADVPLATLERLWGLSRVNTEKLCERLHRLSLLQSFDPNARRIRLHDVIRKYLIHEQGEGLAALHARLLDAHRPPTHAGADASAADWAALPAEEPYMWERLAYHLVGAGLEEELHALLSSETPEGRNAWHEAKDDARGAAPYLADLSDALRLLTEKSSRSLRAGEASAGLAREVRYHFARASINSLSSNIPPALLAAAAASRVLPASKIMAHVQALPQGSGPQGVRKIEVAAAVSEHFDEPLKTEFLRVGLAVAAEAAGENDRASFLIKLSPRATEPLLADVLRLTREFKSPELFGQLMAYAAGLHARLGKADEGFALLDEISPTARRGALTVMAPHLDAEQTRRAVGLAGALPEQEKDEALRALLPRLAEHGEGRAALGLAAAMKNQPALEDALSGAAPFLAGEDLETALEIAYGLQDYPRRVGVRARLALSLPEPRRSQLFEQLLEEVTRHLYKEDLYAQERLMRVLPEEILLGEKVRLLVEWTLSEKDHREREVLKVICVRLAELGCLDEALKMMERSDNLLGDYLEGSAPYLSGAHLERALELALRLEGQYRRESALSHLLRRKAQLGGARDALARALDFEEEDLRERVIDGVAEHLDGDGLRFVLKSRQKIEDSQARDDFELLIAAYAPRALLQKALITLQVGTGEKVQALSLERIGRRLPPDALKRVFAGTEFILDPVARSRARLTLAPFVDDEDRERFVNAVLASEWDLGEFGPGLKSLVGLLPLLDEDLAARVRAYASNQIWTVVKDGDGGIGLPNALPFFVPLLVAIGETEEALAAVREIRDDEHERLRALALLEPHLAPDARAEVLDELTAWIGRNDNHYKTVVVLGAVADGMGPALLRDVLRVAKEKCEPDHIMREIVFLSKRQAEVDSAEEALALAHRIPSGRIDELAMALTGVAKHLPEPHRERALSDALEAACRVVNPLKMMGDRHDYRAQLLAELAGQLAQLPPPTLYELWRNAARVLSNNKREELLYDVGAMAPVLDRLGQGQVIEDVWGAVAAVTRWWP